jgi:hypothetical protein
VVYDAVVVHGGPPGEKSKYLGFQQDTLWTTILQNEGTPVPQEGPIGIAATAVAEKLDAAGSYLHRTDVDRMVDDVSSVIRRYPIPSLLIGLEIGYLLARATRR